MIVTYQLKPLDKNHPRNLGDPLEMALNHVTVVVIMHHIQEQNALLKNCGKYGGTLKRFAVQNEFIIYRKNKLMKNCHF